MIQKNTFQPTKYTILARKMRHNVRQSENSNKMV